MNQYVYFNDLKEMQHYARKNQLSLYAYKKSVYNLTDYAENHPSSEAYVQHYQNQDVTHTQFNKKILKTHIEIISTLQEYIIGYIQRHDKQIITYKSSKSIIEQTKKRLRESTVPFYEDIPEDCSITRLPILTTNKRFHSQKTIRMPK
ncbi:unnamed protein product [Paramecium octaurelia]|uniref:Cytochrome b5 heme-binding domain-containing protein n=1 Tax=Paramecium octaurelia TaxID=43137 RepID=A0A8S1U9N8_PAROT|nr:unnamed protein product [Paramecium octaurelia]CAD8160349.1 unnamed protein product [Paramecium octaurelia]